MIGEWEALTEEWDYLADLSPYDMYEHLLGDDDVCVKARYERFLPKFDWHPSEGWMTDRGTSYSGLFDAAVLNWNAIEGVGGSSAVQRLIRTYIYSGTLKWEYLDSEWDGDNTWTTSSSSTALVDSSTVRPALAFREYEGAVPTDGYTLWVYNNLLYEAHTTDNGATWSTPASTGLDCTGVHAMSAWTNYMSHDVCVALLYQDDTTNYESYVKVAWYDYSATTWYLRDLDIHIPYPDVTDDIGINLTSDGKWIYITSALPPELSKEGDGEEVVSVGYRSYWTYSIKMTSSDTGGDPANWEHGQLRKICGFDMAQNWQMHTYPKTNMTCGHSVGQWDALPTYVMTSVLYDAGHEEWTDTNPKRGPDNDDYRCLVYQLSRDGENWSLPIKIAPENMEGYYTPYYGARMLVMYPYVYCVDYHRTYRAYTTERIFRRQLSYTDGVWYTCPPGARLDAEQYTSDISTGQSQMRQSNVILQNVDGVLDDSILDDSGPVCARIYMGREGYNGTDRKYCLVSSEIVDSVSRREESATNQLAVASRDYTALLSDYMVSPNTYDYYGLLQSFNNFDDLSRVSGLTGKWTVDTNNLVYTAVDGDSGKATFPESIGIYNGICRFGLKIPSGISTGTTIISILFHCIDADNYQEVRYYYNHANPGDSFHDKLSVYDCVSGTPTISATVVSGALSYTPGNWLYIAVENYMLVSKFWYGSDSHTWNPASSTYTWKGPSYTLTGPKDELSVYPILSGSFGVRAKYTGGGDTELRIREVQILDDKPIQLVEDSVRKFAAAGLMLDTEVDGIWDCENVEDYMPMFNSDVPEPPFGSWTSGSYWLEGYGSETGWNYIWWNEETPNNFTLDVTAGGYFEWGIYFRGTDSDTTYMLATYLSGSLLKLIRYDDSVPTELYADNGERSDILYHNAHLRLHVREVKYNWTNEDPEWLFMAVEVNGHLVAWAWDDISAGRPGNHLGFCVWDGAVGDFQDMYISELDMPVELATLDAGEAPISAIQRVLQQQFVELRARHDGSLKIGKPKRLDISATLGANEIFAKESALNRAALLPHYRLIGSEFDSSFFDKSKICAGWGTGFTIVQNPTLETTADIIEYGQDLKHTLREGAHSCNLDTSINPLLERYDRIKDDDGVSWKIQSLQYTFSDATQQMQMGCSGYDIMRPPGAYVGNVMKYHPIFYAPMGELKDTVIQCLINSSQNGTYTGVTVGEEGIGDGLTAPYFDGVTDYGNIYTATLAGRWDGTEGSMVAWFKPYNWGDAVTGYIMRVFYSNDNYYAMYKTTGQYMVGFYCIAGGSSGGQILHTVPSDEYIHMALTWSDTAGYFYGYVNGRYCGSSSFGTWAGTPSLMMLGAQDTTPNYALNGHIAHASIFNFALSQDEILDMLDF